MGSKERSPMFVRRTSCPAALASCSPIFLKSSGSFFTSVMICLRCPSGTSFIFHSIAAPKRKFCKPIWADTTTEGLYLLYTSPYAQQQYPGLYSFRAPCPRIGPHFLHLQALPDSACACGHIRSRPLSSTSILS